MYAIILSSLITFISIAPAYAVYCEADCGRAVRVDYGGVFYADIRPEYRSCGGAYSSGNSISEAYDSMKAQCEKKGCLLHDGFDVNTPQYIRLNINIRPSTVCR